MRNRVSGQWQRQDAFVGEASGVSWSSLKQVVNLILVLKCHFQRGFVESPLPRLCSFSKLSENKREEVCSISEIGNKVQFQLIFGIKLLTESSVRCVLGHSCITSVKKGVGRGGRLGKVGKSQVSDTLRALCG